jgi:hypothetical protein
MVIAATIPAAIVLSTASLVATTAQAAPQSHSSIKQTVRDFNDGWLDAKSDDVWLLQHGQLPGMPKWFHVVRAPNRVALDACGRWPKYGLGENKKGQIVPGVEVSAPNTDGAVYCESGHVSTP